MLEMQWIYPNDKGERMNPTIRFILTEYVLGPPSLVDGKARYPRNKEMPDSGWAMVPHHLADRIDGGVGLARYDLKEYPYRDILNHYNRDDLCALLMRLAGK